MSRARERFDEIGQKIKRETDVSSSSSSSSSSSQNQIGSITSNSSHSSFRRQMLGSSGTLNTITPCAACKLLRRRCAQECPFSPYFSPHDPQKFASVHKVFGASNVSKMLMEVPESQRADAANSLVYEANVRLRDPVYGCMGAISALQHQIQSLQAELNAVRAEILKFKIRDQQANNISTIPPPPHHHLALLSSGIVSIAVPPPPAQIPPPPPPPPPLPASSSSSSMYTPSSTLTGDYSSTVPNDQNVSYFG